MKAIIKAILLDRSLTDGHADSGTETGNSSKKYHFGKAKEPLIVLTNFCRALDVTSNDPSRWWDVFMLSQGGVGQAPLFAESVFNFYEPDYAPEGEFSEKGLTAPEFTLFTMENLINLSNKLWKRIQSWDNDKTTSWSWNKTIHTVAQLIDARNHSLMGHKRQVFFVNIGGFDTHEDQLPKHASLLEQVSDAMAAFYQEIKRQGLSEQVTTFTMSDFGRRISPNATGTDHGWAGHQIVMGGAVKGGKAYGNWPDLSIGGDFDYNNGRIKPELATDQVNASLAKWFGYNENLENLFSSLSNFQENTIDFI